MNHKRTPQMKNSFKYLILASIVLLASCSDEDHLPIEENLVIPQDKFALYMFDGLNERIDLHTITLDSIQRFRKKFIDYQDIVSYDTSGFRFEVIGTSKVNLDSMMAGNGQYKPVAAISEGQILFFADVRSPVSSSFPNYFYFEVVPFPWETKGYLDFCIPHSGVSQEDEDPRLNPTMLQILSSDSKILK